MPHAGGTTIKTPQRELAEAYHSDAAESAATSVAHPYEARVLRGIWATAPYLHNGSVASLAQLLEKPEARAPVFAVGPVYDLDAVGLAESSAGAAPPASNDRLRRPALGQQPAAATPMVPIYRQTKSRDLLEYLKLL